MKNIFSFPLDEEGKERKNKENFEGNFEGMYVNTYIYIMKNTYIYIYIYICI